MRFQQLVYRLVILIGKAQIIGQQTLCDTITLLDIDRIGHDLVGDLRFHLIHRQIAAIIAVDLRTLEKVAAVVPGHSAVTDRRYQYDKQQDASENELPCFDFLFLHLYSISPLLIKSP